MDPEAVYAALTEEMSPVLIGNDDSESRDVERREASNDD